MLRVCVIGLGHIGNLHASIYAEDELVELVGVCDIREDRAKAASKRLGVPYYLDAPTMLKELKPVDSMAFLNTGRLACPYSNRW